MRIGIRMNASGRRLAFALTEEESAYLKAGLVRPKANAWGSAITGIYVQCWENSGFKMEHGKFFHVPARSIEGIYSASTLPLAEIEVKRQRNDNGPLLFTGPLPTPFRLPTSKDVADAAKAQFDAMPAASDVLFAISGTLSGEPDDIIDAIRNAAESLKPLGKVTIEIDGIRRRKAEEQEVDA